MGCEFNETILKGTLTQEEVTAWFEQLVKDTRLEYGHRGYSGSWAEAVGISFPSHYIFQDGTDSTEWLIEHAEKWGPALAVRVKYRGKVCWHIGANCST